MANTAHVEVLRSGERAWSEWRTAHPDIQPDLSGIDFTDHILSLPLDLSHTNLSHCKLGRQFLIKTGLDSAILDHVNAEGSHFIECSMRDVQGCGLELRDASFDRCDLTRARLSRPTPGSTESIARYGPGLGGNMLVASTWVHFDRDFNSDVTGCKLRNCTAPGLDLRCALGPGLEIVDCDLSGCKLDGAFLSGSKVWMTRMDRAQARNADLSASQLLGVSLCDAALDGCVLTGADCRPMVITRATNVRVEPGKGVTSMSDHTVENVATDLSGATMCNATLDLARLVDLRLTNADLSGARVYGVGAWRLDLRGAKQNGLIITPPEESVITVDDIELAQFIYLMRSSEGLRRIVDTLTSKVVLLLGRFNARGMNLLNALRELLRRHDYVPVTFDWPPSPSRSLTETVQLLARMARFVVVDLEEAKSVPHELQSLVPGGHTLVIQPIVVGQDVPYGMFADLRNYVWVREILRADTPEELLAFLESKGLRDMEMHRSEMLARRPHA